MRNKRGDLGDNVMIFVYLFFMIIIGGAIVFGTYIYYGKGYDFREGEAGLLNFKIRECIMNEEVYDNFKEKFYEICELNKEIIDRDFLARICKYPVDFNGECIDERNPFFGEGSRFQECRFKAGKENNNLPRCVETSFSKRNERFDVITGSKQVSRRKAG